MNKTVWKDNLREILKSWPRFLSIFLIMTLGVAFFVGIKSAGPSMIKGARSAYEEGNLPDGTVLSTMGIDDKDLEQLNTLEGIQWLAMQSIDGVLDPDNQILKLFTYDQNPDHSLFNLVEGRLPEKDNEIALDAAYLRTESKEDGFQIGQKVNIQELDPPSGDFIEGMKPPYLTQKEFEVVGFVDTPIYFERYARGLQSNQKGNLSGFAVIPTQAVAGDLSTEVYFWVDKARQYDAYTKEYDDVAKKAQEDIEAILNGRPLSKLNELRATLQQDIFEGEKEIQSGYDELDEGQKKLDKARQELDQHQKEYDEGIKKIQKAQGLLNDKRQELDQGRADYQAGANALEESLQLLNDKEKDYQTGLDQWQKGQKTLKEEIKKGQEELQEAQNSLNEKAQAFEKEKPNLLNSQQQLKNKLDELAQKEAELARGATGGNATTIDEAVHYLDGKIAKVTGQINELKAQIEQDSQIDTSQIEAQIQTQITLIEQLKAQLADYQAQKGALAEQEDLSEIDGRIAQVNGQISEHQGILSQLNAQLNELQNTLLTSDQLANLQSQVAELEATANQLQESKQGLVAGAAEFLQAKEALQSQLTEVEKGLNAGEEIKAGRQALIQGQQTLQNKKTEGQKALDQAKNELDQGRRALDEGYRELEQGRQQLASARVQLSQGEVALQEGQNELNRQKQTLDEAKQSLDEGEKTYKNELDNFKKEKEQALKELKEAEDTLQEAKDELKELEEPVYYVHLRDHFLAYDSLYDNAQKINEISNVFPVLFFAIAILVTFTTIKRMADEQRNYMGTMLQMGYPERVIVSKFASYAGIAAILAIIAGSIIGYLVFPTMIVEAYSTMYNFRTVHVSYSILTIIMVAVIALVSALGPAIWTPHSMLQTQPARLLVPEPPKAGHQIMLEKWDSLWKRLTFNQKMTVRNLLRYKGRNLMTLVGVAGCTMLILTGFGMSDSITGMVEDQFDRIQQFDGLVYLDNEASSSVDEVKAQFEEIKGIEDTLAVAAKQLEAREGNVPPQDVSVITPLEGQEVFEQFVHLKDRQEKKRLSINQGAVISEKLAKLYHLSVGDTLTLYDDTRQMFNIPITGIAENYVGHYVYMDEETFGEVFHEQPELSGVYVKYTNLDQRAESEQAITDLPNVLTTVDINSLRQSTASALESLNIVTLVLIVSAAGLAFVVLYNLTNINVSERIRELSTIKVLGFYDYEVSLYIFYEILVLTALGTGLGLIAGKILNRYILNVVELDELLFYPQIHFNSYLWSVVMTFAFSMIVMLVMHFKLKHINMVEALKGVD